MTKFFLKSCEQLKSQKKLKRKIDFRKKNDRKNLSLYKFFSFEILSIFDHWERRVTIDDSIDWIDFTLKSLVDSRICWWTFFELRLRSDITFDFVEIWLSAKGENRTFFFSTIEGAQMKLIDKIRRRQRGSKRLMLLFVRWSHIARCHRWQWYAHMISLDMIKSYKVLWKETSTTYRSWIIIVIFFHSSLGSSCREKPMSWEAHVVTTCVMISFVMFIWEIERFLLFLNLFIFLTFWSSIFICWCTMST